MDRKSTADREDSNAETIKLYECATCAKKFLRKRNVAAHLRTHAARHCPWLARPERISTSGTSCGLIALPRTGVRSSAAEPFECAVCPSRFAGKDELTAHVLESHRSRDGWIPVKPHGCPKCGVSFAQLRHLQSHEERHHPTGWMTVDESTGIAMFTSHTAVRSISVPVHPSMLWKPPPRREHD